MFRKYLILCPVLAATVGCTPTTDPQPSTGGTASATGGTLATGGTVATGGTTMTGGMTATGGMVVEPMSNVRVRFELSETAQAVGSIPYPDDLYFDDSGRIAIGTVAGEEKSQLAGFWDGIKSSLHRYKGFSSTGPTFMYLTGGDVDPATLPKDGDNRFDASVALYKVNGGTLERIPSNVFWLAAEKQLSVSPATGYIMEPSARYAVVVRRSLKATTGELILASEGFASIRDLTAPPPGKRQAKAYAQISPILGALEKGGTPRNEVSAIQVFTIQNRKLELDNAFKAVKALPAVKAVVTEVVPRANVTLDDRLGVAANNAPGFATPTGDGPVAHSHIGFMIHGSYDAPNFIIDGMGMKHPFADENGNVQVRKTEKIPFTLILPKGDLKNRKVVIFTHGLPYDRSLVLSIADRLAEEGYAVFSADGPHMGMRARLTSTLDAKNLFTGKNEPDGFIDFHSDPEYSTILQDVYNGILGPVELANRNPLNLPGAFQQDAVEVYTALRLIREGDWSAFTSQPELATLTFDGNDVTHLGWSMGGLVAAMAAGQDIPMKRYVNAAGLLTNWAEGVLDSPSNMTAFGPVYGQRFGFTFDFATSRPMQYYVGIGIAKTLWEGMDPAAYGQPSTKTPVLNIIAEKDENIMPWSSTSYAKWLNSFEVNKGGPFISGENRRSLYVSKNTAHTVFLSRQDGQMWQHPLSIPFAKLASPMAINNPVNELQDQIVAFLKASNN